MRFWNGDTKRVREAEENVMDPNLTYNIYTGVIWDWRVATDLFAGGVGVGAFLFAFALWRFGGEGQRKLAQTASVIAPIAVSFGLLLLFWKLGNRLNAYQLGLNIAPTSTMWWGAFIQGAFVALSVVFAYRLLFPSSRLLAVSHARARRLGRGRLRGHRRDLSRLPAGNHHLASRSGRAARWSWHRSPSSRRPDPRRRSCCIWFARSSGKAPIRPRPSSGVRPASCC